MNVFVKCPVYLTDHYKLRKISRDDTDGLKILYSDAVTISKINNDNLDLDSPDESLMKKIENWINAYDNKLYVRWSIIEKISNKVIASLELTPERSVNRFFDTNNSIGILKLDVLSLFEHDNFYSEIFEVVKKMLDHFEIKKIITKCDSHDKLRFISLLATVIVNIVVAFLKI